jgi:hypothetical protein
MLKVFSAIVCVAVVLGSTSCARLAAQTATPVHSLERLLQEAFAAKNPKVTRAKVLELRSTGMGAGPYVLLGSLSRMNCLACSSSTTPGRRSSA